MSCLDTPIVVVIDAADQLSVEVIDRFKLLQMQKRTFEMAEEDREVGEGRGTEFMESNPYREEICRSTAGDAVA